MGGLGATTPNGHPLLQKPQKHSTSDRLENKWLIELSR